MADRYWVGGTGTWNTTSTTNWSTQSGGSGGASVPTASDSVFFDQASTYTVTMTGSLACLDITVSAGTVTFATGSNPSLNVSGSWSTIAGTVWNSTGGIVFSATSSKTINSNNISISGAVTFNGAGGTWTLQSNFTVGAALTTTLTAGTLALDTYTYSTGLFASSGTGVRSISFGTGQITLTAATAVTIWNTATLTNFSYTGTSNVVVSAGGANTKTINTGTMSEAQALNWNLTNSAGTITFTASNAVKNLTINGAFTLSNIAITIYGNYTYTTATALTAGTNAWTFGATSGTQTLNSGGTTHDFPFTKTGAGTLQLTTNNLTLGSTRAFTLTTGALDLNNLTLTASSLSSNNSNTRSILFGTTGQINIGGNNATILDFTTATNFTYTGTPKIYSTYSGGTGTRTFNFGGTAGATSTNTFNVSIGTSGDGLVITAGTDIKALTGSYFSINLTGIGGSLSNTVRSLYGDLTVPAGATLTAGTNATSFISTAGQTVTTNGVTLDFPITVNATGGFSLGGALTIGSTRTLTHTAGQINFADFTLSTGLYSSSNSNVRSLRFVNTGQLTLTSNNATIFDVATATNFTYENTPKIYSTYSGGTGTRTFNFGGTAGATSTNVFDVKYGSSGDGIVITAGTDIKALTGSFNNVDLTGQGSGSLSNTTRSIYGNFTAPSGITVTAGTAVTSFVTTTSQTITVGLATISFPFTINNTGTTTLASAVNLGTSASQSLLTLTAGALELNDKILTCYSISSTNSNLRSIDFGTYGQININGNSATIVDFTTASGFTYSGEPRIYSSYTGGAGTRTFNFGGTAGALPGNAFNFFVAVLGSTGGVGAGANLDTSGGGGGGISGTPGGAAEFNGGAGGVAGNGTEIFSDLAAAVTSAGYTYGSGGGTAGGSGSSPANAKNGGNATGFGAGGGGAGLFGGNGGNGYLGGGGGGAAGYTQVDMSGGNGGDGAVVIQMLVNGSLQYVVRTTGSSYSTPAGTTKVKIWAIGAGGGGAGATDVDAASGGGGAAGGIAILETVTTGTINYSLGVGGSGGTGANAGSGGTDTTVTFSGVTITANGGAGGTYNDGVNSAGGTFTGNIVNLYNSGIGLSRGTDTIAATGFFYDFNLYTPTGRGITLSNTARTIFGDFTVPASINTLTAGTTATTLSAPSTAPSYSDGYSVFFDGTGDYIDVTGSSTSTSGDWTVEFWMYPASNNGSIIADYRPTSTNGWYITFSMNSGTQLNLYLNATDNLITLNSSIFDTWSHIAIVKYSNVITVYVNGVSVFTKADTNTFQFPAASARPRIGANGGFFAAAPSAFLGHVSNFRQTFQALYTSNFTPSTIPLTTTSQGATASNVDLLVFQGNQIKNNGVGSYTFAAAGNASLSNFSPFGTQTPLTKTVTTNGRTLDFPITIGSGVSGPGINQLAGNLTIGATRAYTFSSGTLDVNNKTISGGNGITIIGGTGMTLENTGGSTVTTSLAVTHTNSPFLLGTNFTTTNASGYTLTMGSISFDTYTLTAKLFSSNNANNRFLYFGTGKMVLDGAVTGTIWTTATVTNFGVTGTPLVECIGGGTGVTKTINTGALSETNSISFSLLETTGTVTYAFTASNAVRNLVVNGSQTLTNVAISIYGGFTYNTTNGITKFGGGTSAWTFAATSGTKDITISTTNTLFGDSIYFEGASDYLDVVNSSTCSNFGTSNFTVEGWFYIVPTGTSQILYDFRTGPADIAGALAFNGSAVSWYVSGADRILSGAVDVNKWIHLAVVRNGSSTNLYVNGTVAGSTYTDSNNYVGRTDRPRIGHLGDGTGTLTFFGYMSNLRVVKGVAVYTGNFTPPSLANLATSGSGSAAAYPSTANVDISFAATDTSLLTGQSSTTITDTSNNAFTITVVGNTGPAQFSVGDIVFYYPWTFNGAGGAWRLQSNVNIGPARTVTLTAGTFDLQSYNFNCGFFSSSGSTARTINFGTGKMSLIGVSTGTIWNTSTNTNLTVSGTPLVECYGGGVTVTKTINTGALSEANSVSFSLLETAGTVTYAFTASNTLRNLILNGLQTLSNIAVTIYGDYTYSTVNGTTTLTAGTNAWTFGATSGTKAISAGGVTHDFPWTFNGAGGTWRLDSAITIGSTRTITLTNGTLDLNSFTYTAGSFATASGTKNITFDGGSFTISSSGATAWNNAQPTNFTTSAGTGNGTISLTNSSAKTFVGGGSTYAAALNQGGAGALTVTGSNSFSDITNTYKGTGATTITLAAGTTQTVTNFTAAGEASRLLTLNSATAYSQATIYSTAGLSGYISGIDYLSVRDIAFTPFITNGTDYIRWYLGANSTNSGNNTGALFLAYSVSARKVYVIDSGTSWTTPSDFNVNDNIIHLFGGGGGGAGGNTTNFDGGGGGGGGGYTKTSNVYVYSGQVLSYSVGSGGTGGSSNNNGSNATSTSFITYSANGGFGGIGRTAGSGGSGSTYNGGNGGSGADGPNSTNGQGGGGGGGAGGPSGNGGTGGSSTNGASSTRASGAGGGGNGGGTNGGAGIGGVAANGGAGGNNALGTGGGVAGLEGTDGTVGGGGSGSGSTGTVAGRGSIGSDILNSVGGGGGGGGGSGRNGVPIVAGGDSLGYGGGGGGGGFGLGVGESGGDGYKGAIIIEYVPGTAPLLASATMFFMFR